MKLWKKWNHVVGREAVNLGTYEITPKQYDIFDCSFRSSIEIVYKEKEQISSGSEI